VQRRPGPPAPCRLDLRVSRRPASSYSVEPAAKPPTAAPTVPPMTPHIRTGPAQLSPRSHMLARSIAAAVPSTSAGRSVPTSGRAARRWRSAEQCGLGRGPAAMPAHADHVTPTDPVVLDSYMPHTTKPNPRPLFTPSTLPESGTPDPIVTFIENALLAIANRQDEADIPEPSA
jgi:hypothetical protein